MRTSRAIRLVIRLFLLLLASSMSLVSFLGGYSALLILGDEDNIDLDIDFEGDILDPDFEIQIEFEINNMGYFDLEDLNIEMKLYLVFDWVNLTGDGTNVTQYVKIYEDDKSFRTIEAGEKKKNSITIDTEDLEKVNLTEIAIYSDKTRDPVIEFEADEIIIKAKYSLGLISFKVVIEDYKLGELGE